MVYVSDKVRDQVRMQRFREALSGARREARPEETLKDFGVTEPIRDEDIKAIGGVYGCQIHKEHQEEESILTGKPVPDEPIEKQTGILKRVLSAGRSERASRAETVSSRSSTSISYETPDHPHKEVQVSKRFHDRAMDPANNADPQARDVNAVQMVMENVFDWDFHERHHGDTVTPQLLSRLIKSLRTNIKAACPTVPDVDVLELFETLAENNWLGDIVNVRNMTQHVIEAYLEAQNGNPKALDKMRRFFQGAIRFNERFYAAIEHEGKVPLRTLAQAMERQGQRPVATRPRFV